MALISQLKLLITLADVDGEFAEAERLYIANIAKANGFSENQLNSLMEEPHDATIPSHLSPHEKFNLIFTLVQLMKIDEKLYKEEIRFCARVAAKLGYSEEMMFEMMLKVKITAMSDDEIESLRLLTEKYLGHH